MMGHPEFYGSATVGERGQIVLPARLRKELEIEPGDKILVLGQREMKHVILFKAEILDQAMAMFNSTMSQIQKAQAEQTGDDEHEQE